MAGERTLKITVGKRYVHEDPRLNLTLDNMVSAIEAVAGVEVEIPGPTPAAGVAFLVPHDLGGEAPPDRVATIDAGDSGGHIYATQNDKLQWTSTYVVIRCTVAGDTNITIRLTRRPS